MSTMGGGPLHVVVSQTEIIEDQWHPLVASFYRTELQVRELFCLGRSESYGRAISRICNEDHRRPYITLSSYVLPTRCAKRKPGSPDECWDRLADTAPQLSTVS